MSGEHRPVPWRWATPATPGRAHYGSKMGILSAAMGKAHMPWQRHVSRVASEVDPDTGEWAYSTVVLSVQRQAGKTTLVIPSNLHECMRCPDSYCWYTAQTRQAARDNLLRDVKPLLRSKLAPLVKLRKSNGSEGIEIPANGSEYRVFTSGSDELHGKTNRRVTVDEAWSYGALEGLQLMQAIVPTFTTTAGQTWIVSTAGTAESAFLLEWIHKGRSAVDSGRNRGIAHFECAIPPDCDPTDLSRPGPRRDAFLQLVYANHPADGPRAEGFTLRRSAVDAALEQLGPWEFARAFGNLWSPGAETLIGMSDWLTVAEKRPVQLWPAPAPGEMVLAFDVAPDETDAAILAAWFDDGWPTLAVIDARPGVAWLVPRLVELTTPEPGTGRGNPLATVFNDYGPSAVAADAARRAGLHLTGLSGREYATACGSLRSHITHHGLTVQPDPALDAAAANVTRRALGELWVWDRKSSAGTIAAIVGATCALWMLQHQPEPFEVR